MQHSDPKAVENLSTSDSSHVDTMDVDSLVISDSAELAGVNLQDTLETAGDTWGLTSHLDTQSIGRFQRVSKFFLAFSSKPYDWRLRIVKDFGYQFGFNMETLTKFEEEATSLDVKINYQEIYKHLRQLHKNKKIVFRYCFIPHALDNHLLLLAVCANVTNPELIKACLPKDEELFWKHVALAAGCDIAIKSIQAKLDFGVDLAAMTGDLVMLRCLMEPANIFNGVLGFAVVSGNLAMVKFLLNPKNNFGLSPNQETLWSAASSGNIAMLQFFLDPKNGFDLHPDQETLKYAAASGNLALLRFLLDPTFDLHPDISTLEAAVGSDNPDMVRFLLDPANNFNLHITIHPLLINAARSPAMLQFLLDANNGFGLHPNQRMLYEAARSGNLDMLRFLVDPKFGLHPDQETLIKAAFSGSLDMVRFLLDPHNGFNLQPDRVTLAQAGAAANQGAVHFLLDPAHGFNLNPEGTLGNVTQRYTKIKSAIRNYASAEPAAKKLELLLEAAALSLRDFFRLCTHACVHPELYQLKKVRLSEFVAGLGSVAKQIPHVPVEREAIIPLLEKASKEMAQSGQIDSAKALGDIADGFRAERSYRSVFPHPSPLPQQPT